MNIKNRKILPVFEADNLRSFFLSHLSRIYCAKAHLVERFPEIADQAEFSDLYHAIVETIDDVKKQMARIENIFSMLDSRYSFELCDPLIILIDSVFAQIQIYSEDLALRDMKILFYMHSIESLEAASFRVLLLMVKKLKNKQIKQLLKKNYEEAQADRTLMVLITSNTL